MKTFMEEYGLIIVAILVVAALVALAINFNKKSTDNANTAVDNFNKKATTYVDENVTKNNGNTKPQ